MSKNQRENHGTEKILFRAVSEEELNDIDINGIRNISGAYETVKLFALSCQDAKNYGLLNQKFDAKPFWIVSVTISESLYKSCNILQADGMNYISVEKKYLTLLKFKDINFKPG